MNKSRIHLAMGVLLGSLLRICFLVRDINVEEGEVQGA